MVQMQFEKTVEEIGIENINVEEIGIENINVEEIGIENINVEEIGIENIFNKRGSCDAACCKGWSVIICRAFKCECFLWNSISHQKIQLPRIVTSFSSFDKCILSFSPTKTQCTVLLFHDDVPRILFWTLGQKQWTEQDYYDDLGFLYSDAIAFDRNIYVLSMFGELYEIELQPTALRFVSRGVEVPSVLALRRHFVDSCGELFIVKMFYTSKLEVFKFDFIDNKFMKIYSLGDRVFILSSNSVSAAAQEMGIARNCIYFTEENEKSLCVFNFEDQSLSITENRVNRGPFWFLDHGIMPVLGFPDSSRNTEQGIIIKQEQQEEELINTNKESEVEDEQVKMDEINWCNLPMELHMLIGQCVSKGQDYMSFRSVCRMWRSIAPPCCWSPHLPRSTAIQYPWLMFIQRETGVCDFYDPRDNVTHHMYNDDLINCEVLFSKDGWLLISRGPRSMFLLEPFTKKRIELPDLPQDNYISNSICFSESPTSPNSIIFGISHVAPDWLCFLYLDSTRKVWDEIIFDNDRSFLPSWNNPVFLNGIFYCLDQCGSLGVFELRGTEWTWKILDKPQPLNFPSDMCRNFFVAIEEELFSVFLGYLGEWIKVFKLHFGDSEWVEVKSLGNQMLFVNQSTSLAVRAHEERMENKLYFPIFSNINGRNMFYSMETCRYQTFGSDCFIQNFYNTKEQFHSTWIQPRVIPTLRWPASW